MTSPTRFSGDDNCAGAEMSPRRYPAHPVVGRFPTSQTMKNTVIISVFVRADRGASTRSTELIPSHTTKGISADTGM